VAAPVSTVTPVAISLARSGSSITISWPVAASGWTLQSTPSLINPSWQTVSGVVNNSATVTFSPGDLFFRLAR
jgi:hypothetical protein